MNYERDPARVKGDFTVNFAVIAKITGKSTKSMFISCIHFADGKQKSSMTRQPSPPGQLRDLDRGATCLRPVNDLMALGGYRDPDHGHDQPGRLGREKDPEFGDEPKSCREYDLQPSPFQFKTFFPK
jgi:hypothetical protein